MSDDLLSDARTICELGLFDPDWYLKRYPDVALVGVDPAEHYLRIGWRLNRRFAAKFDSDEGFGSLSPIWPASAPANEERLASLVDPIWYRRSNPDLSYLPASAVVDHFLRHGRFEGRMPNAYFSSQWYLREYCLSSEAEILAHHLENGITPAVDPNPFFDGAWYRERFMQGFPSWMTAIEHFMRIGRHLNCWPHPAWSEAEYVRGNIELARRLHREGYASGYEQFCVRGHRDVQEMGHCRLPFILNDKAIDLDEKVYKADNHDVAHLVSTGRYANGVEHFFREGFAQCEAGLRVPFTSKRMVKHLRTEEGYAHSGGCSLALFAHFDADGIVDDYVYAYLDALRANDVDIVFITSACRPSDLVKLKSLCRKIIFKNEAGRDFGSWYIGITALGEGAIGKYDEVILANDSVYFPVNDPAPMFSRMRGQFDFWGVADSYEQGQYHVQSWFLVFGRVAQETVLKKFVENYRRNIYLTKWGQIVEYELGLTASARAHALSVGAWCSLADIREDILHNPGLAGWRHYAQDLSRVNPTHDLWDVAIEYYGSPALKLELVRDNPKRIPDVDRYPGLLPEKIRPIVVAHAARQKGVRHAGQIIARRDPVFTAADQLNVIHDFAGIPSAGRRLVILAHYDPHGELDPHVLHMVRGLRAADCDILFVTGSKEEACWASARREAVRVIVKTDVARDFGSWALAIEHCRPMFAQYDSVVWMNDSIYFPLIDVAPIFDEMDDYDFWGLVDSHYERQHIMSWFWSFNRKLVNGNFFDRYLQDFSPSYTKWEQIRNFEMRYPKMIKEAGFRTGTWMEAQEVIAAVRARGHSLGSDANVMHNAWQLTIEEFRSPAVKVELLRDNPLGIDLSNILDVVKRETTYDASLIVNHMRRIKASHIFGSDVSRRA